MLKKTWIKSILIMIAVLVGLIGYWLLPGSTPEIRTENGISILEPWDIGGIKQWLLIRGKDRSKPVILFLHGGAGAPYMPYHHQFREDLEDHFVFVHWDQRGAGKSYDPNIPADTFTIEQFVNDTCEVSVKLREYLSAPKIILVGHSWGTVIGTYAAKQCPEHYRTYVGVGQVVDYQRAEHIAYGFVKRRATEANNDEAIAFLASHPFPIQGTENILRFQKFRDGFGGELYVPGSFWKYIVRALVAPEYSLLDIFKYVKGLGRTGDLMWGKTDVDLMNDVEKLDIPVYFFAGETDYNAPTELVNEFYAALQVPKKTMIHFERSGHWVFLEQSEAFSKALTERVLAETK
jgi:pimeloyl-ACP methyl ester carboxylesterase